jgi:hypothetical protein
MMTKWMPVNAVVLGIAVVAACSANDGSGGSSGGGPSAGGASGSGGSSGSIGVGGSGGGIDLDSSSSGGSGGSGNPGDSGCQSYSDEAKQTYEPADIIWAVDTSGSMIEEAQAVQQNINAFSQQIVATGIDAHVVMLAAYPFFFLPGICVGPPLGSGLCTPAGADSKPPNFFHHPSAVIDSVDAAVRLVQYFPDYKFMLRPGVPKYIVVVTDDNSANAEGSSGNAGKYHNNPTGFINDYTAIDPIMNDGSGGPLWKLSAIYAFTQCSNAANVGTVWKQIVDATGGIHGDICACPPGGQAECSATFQKIFDDLAKKIITGSKPLACQWTIPAPKPGETLDPNKVNVEFFDAANGTSETVYHVNDAGACDATLGGWYYDNNAAPTTVLLCPASCGKVTGAAQGSKINVVFGCATQNIPT